MMASQSLSVSGRRRDRRDFRAQLAAVRAVASSSPCLPAASTSRAPAAASTCARERAERTGRAGHDRDLVAHAEELSRVVFNSSFMAPPADTA